VSLRLAPAGDLELDVERVESLIHRRIEGDLGAVAELTEALCAFVGPALARTRLLASLRSEDAPREVLTRVLEKLLHKDAHALRQFVDWRGRHPGRTAQDWLLIVLMNAAREHVREIKGRRREGAPEPSRNRLLNEYLQLAEVDIGVRPPFTPQQTARQVVEFARARLPAAQLEALERWLEGAEPEEIARAMKLDSREAGHRLVRAATATLRREFAAPGGRDEGEAPPPSSARAAPLTPPRSPR
jgi:DNA-directed RNA polymerase specialized sigma24 family protein